MSDSGVEIAAEITKLTPKKGDLIVVRLTQDIGDDRMRKLAERLHDHFGDKLGWKTIIVPPVMRVTLQAEPNHPPNSLETEILKRVPGALATRKGVRAKTIAAQVGRPLSEVDAALEAMRELGFLSKDGGWWRKRGGPV